MDTAANIAAIRSEQPVSDMPRYRRRNGRGNPRVREPEWGAVSLWAWPALASAQAPAERARHALFGRLRRQLAKSCAYWVHDNGDSLALDPRHSHHRERRGSRSPPGCVQPQCVGGLWLHLRQGGLVGEATSVVNRLATCAVDTIVTFSPSACNPAEHHRAICCFCLFTRRRWCTNCLLGFQRCGHEWRLPNSSLAWRSQFWCAPADRRWLARSHTIRGNTRPRWMMHRGMACLIP
jgi:hypothetical protein